VSAPRPVELHSHGPDVVALQRALVKAHVRPASRKATGLFGVITRYEVRRFQRAHKIEPTGHVGQPTWRALSPSIDAYGRHLLGVERTQMAARARAAAAARARAAALAKLHASFTYRVLAATSDARTHAYAMAYSQSWTRTNLPAFPSVPRATDCSGYATWVLRHAGVNPGGHTFVGWTGTLGREGWAVSASTSSMHVGDLVFYGGFPYSHVAVYIGRGLVSSHGSPGIHVEPFNYRSVSAVRRYHA
jgi:cell wall-associated NlpC family hydrolase